MKNYQKTQKFTLRVKQAHIDKLKEIALAEEETSAAVLRSFIVNYELPRGVCSTSDKDDSQ